MLLKREKWFDGRLNTVSNGLFFRKSGLDGVFMNVSAVTAGSGSRSGVLPPKASLCAVRGWGGRGVSRRNGEFFLRNELSVFSGEIRFRDV